VPHYPLSGDEEHPIQQAFSVGRARFLITDNRSCKSSPSHDSTPGTILGAEQKAWLKEELHAASLTYPVVFWVNPTPWIAAEEEGTDHWGGYPEERRELADWIAGLSIPGFFMLSGDAHMLAYDDGRHNTFARDGAAGFPVLHAAPLHQIPRVKGGPYTGGPVLGSNQFAVVRVEDDGGDRIRVRYEGRKGSGKLALEADFSVDLAK
jgi:alkaline phosphatase D